MTSSECTSCSSPHTNSPASTPVPEDTFIGFVALLPELLLIVCACVLALGRMGPDPELLLPSVMSVRIEMTPNVCEASW